MHKWLILAIFILFACSQQRDAELVPLFDLKAYLQQLEQNWSLYELEKVYQSGSSSSEGLPLSKDEFKDMLNLFNPYDINKPDFADRFTMEDQEGDSGNITVYKAKDKGQKIRSFTLYGQRTFPDSIKINYLHESFIGRSQHHVSISGASISLIREEKYAMSDSLISRLQIRPIP